MAGPGGGDVVDVACSRQCGSHHAPWRISTRGRSLFLKQSCLQYPRHMLWNVNTAAPTHPLKGRERGREILQLHIVVERATSVLPADL